MATHSTTLTVTQSAEHRRSIRKYTGESIPEADLREILRVAGLAPSPWNIQPWRVTVVRDPEVKQKLMAASYGQPQVGAADAVFVIHSDMADAMEHAIDFIHPGMADRAEKEAANIRKTFSGMGDEASETWGNAISYIFLGYLLLAIQSHGYSSSPMLGFVPDQVKELLELPAHSRIPAIVAVGVGAEEGFPHHRHPLERYVKWV